MELYTIIKPLLAIGFNYIKFLLVGDLVTKPLISVRY